MKFQMASICVLALLVSCGNDDSKIVREKVYVGEQSENQSGRDPSYNAVTNKYGALKIEAGTVDYKSSIVPWSSWWYPYNQSILFEREDGEKSTLWKYDRFVEKKHSQNTTAQLVEELEVYDPGEVAWAGLCHAWSMASVLHKEPTRAIVREGVNFSVADQKALLLKSYENAGELEIYGERYNGNSRDDYADIYPDQFHRLVQTHLRDEKKPFIMDYDPSFPVWSVPVYEARFSVTKANDTEANVKTWVTVASPLVSSPNYVGTKRVVKIYTYTLTGEWNGNSFVASGGRWTGDSEDDHPDYLIAYPEKVSRASLNREISPQIVDEIVEGK